MRTHLHMARIVVRIVLENCAVVTVLEGMSNSYISLYQVFTFIGQLAGNAWLIWSRKKPKVFQCCYEWTVLQRSGFHETPPDNGAKYRAILHGLLYTHMPQDEI